MVPGVSGRKASGRLPRDPTVTSNQRRLTDHAHQSTGSYELALSAVLFGLVGLWLDRKLGITPVLMISFTLLGFVGAGLSIYYRYRHQMAQLRAETAELRQAASRPGTSTPAAVVAPEGAS